MLIDNNHVIFEHQALLVPPKTNAKNQKSVNGCELLNRTMKGDNAFWTQKETRILQVYSIPEENSDYRLNAGIKCHSALRHIRF